MNENIAVKVRESLREPAFRRYEDWIGQATKGSVIIDTIALIPSVKASSFKVGIREAMRGFRLYNYKSDKIPFNYNLKQIVIQELEDGRVRLYNEQADRINSAQAKLEQKSVIVDIDGNVAHSNQKEIIHPENTRKVEFDPNIMLQWCDERINGPLKTKRSELLWMFKAMCPEDVEMIKMIPTQYPELDVEELGHGWWRLHK
jgi:hypothetical protein